MGCGQLFVGREVTNRGGVCAGNAAANRVWEGAIGAGAGAERPPSNDEQWLWSAVDDDSEAARMQVLPNGLPGCT